MTHSTALYQAHQKAGGKLVDFHGWLLPLHYGSQLNEHHAVRQSAGMFDVSHMTVVDILGAGGRQFLRKLLTNDVDRLTHSGSALYSTMCNERGGIIDDLIVYQRSPDNYRMVLNAATKEQDLRWIYQHAEGFSIGIQERNDLSMIAVQGPKAIGLVQECVSPESAAKIAALEPFGCIDMGNYFIGRTGYTGEDGVEIILPHAQALELWDRLIGVGVQPCGLGARDTLRLEAGLMLYGQDMDTSTTPLESGLAWTVSFEPQDRDFIGMGALLSQKRDGISRKMVGLILEERGIMRHGQKVIVSGHPDGLITSGSWSPTLLQSIALARVPKGVGDMVMVDIRGKLIPAKVVKPRFVKHGQPV